MIISSMNEESFKMESIMVVGQLNNLIFNKLKIPNIYFTIYRHNFAVN